MSDGHRRCRSSSTARVVPDREEIGNKAHSLATMHRLGMPVPPAFVLTTAVGKRCADGLPDDVWADVLAALAHLEAATGGGSARSCWSPCVPARPRACRG